MTEKNKEITFITGNQNKADKLAQYLDFPLLHKKLDLDEIQSLDLNEIVEHKVRQAYAEINSPVLVEDVSLEFKALGGLPGPFIKFFVDQVPFETICEMLGDKPRNATAKCTFGYYDGELLKTFTGKLEGKIAETPAEDNGFGWDRIFIPEGYEVTRAELNAEDDRKTYIQIKPLEELKTFFDSL